VDFDPSLTVLNKTAVSQLDVLLTKYYLLGNFLWVISIGSTHHDIAMGIKTD
jgi:hypothetical protein